MLWRSDMFNPFRLPRYCSKCGTPFPKRVQHRSRNRLAEPLCFREMLKNLLDAARTFDVNRFRHAVDSMKTCFW
jgi:hypothetical protein